MGSERFWAQQKLLVQNIFESKKNSGPKNLDYYQIDDEWEQKFPKRGIGWEWKDFYLD